MTNSHRPTGNCAACGGRGAQPAILGGMRPCSRCRYDEFQRWYDAQPGLSAAPAAPAPSPEGDDAA
jgi:hypothetical protein